MPGAIVGPAGGLVGPAGGLVGPDPGGAGPPGPGPAGPPAFPWVLFRGVVTGPELDWSNGILRVTLDCRDKNRLWHRVKAGIPQPGNFIETDGEQIEHDPAAAPFGDGTGIKDGSVFRWWVEHYWPGSPPLLFDVYETNPDWVYLPQLERLTARTDLGAFLDEFITYQDPYTRYHLDPDHHAWYRKLAPVGSVADRAVPAPYRLAGDAADVGAGTTFANITASWDMDRIRRRLFVAGKSSKSLTDPGPSGWVVNVDAPEDAGEEIIDAPSAITSADRDRIGAWYFANMFRAFLSGRAEVPIPGYDGWRVGQTLYAKDRQLNRYTTHPFGSGGFLPTIITQVQGRLAAPAAALGLGIRVDGTLLSDLIVSWQEFSFTETGFAQPGSARIVIELWDPNQAIAVPDLASIVVTTDGTAPLTYSLGFGDVEPSAWQNTFVRPPTAPWTYPDMYHFELILEDPDMPPGGTSRGVFQNLGSDNKAVPGAGVEAVIIAEVWGDEDETIESDEYTIDVTDGITNVFGQIPCIITRSASPTVPAVKWRFDAQWLQV